MKRKLIIKLLLLFNLIIFGGLILLLTVPSYKTSSIDFNIGSKTRFIGSSFSDLKSSYLIFTNITVISDMYEGVEWNNDTSDNPDIAVDNSGNLHVVWQDYSPGEWGGGSECEILYANYTSATGKWSNVTVVSDMYQGVEWNTDDSSDARIVVDSSDNLHVIWEDHTDGIWGTDKEIMYANYTSATGKWSNASVVSDGYGGVWDWNINNSVDAAIAVDDNDNLHVVWEDYSPGVWGPGYDGSDLNLDDKEIMYVKYNALTGQWSNASVISDGYGGVWGWNTNISADPDIAVNNKGDIYVVWEEYTPGVWGSGGGDHDEIMLAIYSSTKGKWSNASVISDGYGGVWWHNGSVDDPRIAVDGADNFHVVWGDDTPGDWGSDDEIMYVKISIAPLIPFGLLFAKDEENLSGVIIITIIGIASVVAIAIIIILIKKDVIFKRKK